MLPLEKIKILDFSQAYSAPLCAMMLGDMGAKVIKVERLQGESVRRGRPAGMDEMDKTNGSEADSSVFLALNRNKKGIAVDIRQKEGIEITRKLVKDADVLIENFRPGVMDRLGLGYEEVSRNNSQIVYASLTGWGDKGPLAHKIGGDMWAQAMGGVVSRQGSVGGAPSLSSVMFVDQGTAGLMAFGIMVALFGRQQQGKGQYLTISLLHGLLHMESTEISEYLVDGRLVTKIGRGMPPHVTPPPAGVYTAEDGDVLTIFGVGSQWLKFCKVLGVEELENDEKFATDAKRIENRDELYLILDKAFLKKTRAKWQELFKKARMRCDPCLNYEELFAHSQVHENEIITTIKHPVRGDIKSISSPVKLHNTEKKINTPPPLIGEHTREILQELNYSDQEIDDLVKKQVIKI